MCWALGFVVTSFLHLFLPWYPLLIAECILWIPALIFKLLDNNIPETQNEMASHHPPIIKLDQEKHVTHVVISGHNISAPAQFIPR